jgi:hypothetical protein
LDKKEIKQQITRMLEAGRSKTETFQAFSGGAAKDRLLAFWIASYSDQNLYEQHYRKINILITIIFIQALLGAVVGFGLGAAIGPTAALGFAALCGLIPLLFAYGFYRNYAGAYNIYIALSVVQIPRALAHFGEAPVISAIGMGISLAMLAFVWYLRTQLFPDFAFIKPKKVKGQYVFSN